MVFRVVPAEIEHQDLGFDVSDPSLYLVWRVISKPQHLKTPSCRTARLWHVRLHQRRTNTPRTLKRTIHIHKSRVLKPWISLAEKQEQEQAGVPELFLAWKCDLKITTKGQNIEKRVYLMNAETKEYADGLRHQYAAGKDPRGLMKIDKGERVKALPTPRRKRRHHFSEA